MTCHDHHTYWAENWGVGGRFFASFCLALCGSERTCNGMHTRTHTCTFRLLKGDHSSVADTVDNFQSPRPWTQTSSWTSGASRSSPMSPLSVLSNGEDIHAIKKDVNGSSIASATTEIVSGKVKLGKKNKKSKLCLIL